MSGSRGNIRRTVWRVIFASVILLLRGASPSAHNVTPEPVVEVFLRATANNHLALNVWLPMVALGDANLPRTDDGHFVRDEIRPALDVVARGIVRDLELQAGDDPLPTPTVATTLSPDESFVAIDLDYPLQADRTNLSARFHTFRGNGRMITTQVHYIVDDRRTRTFIVDGPAQRIAFAPTVVDVLRHFVNDGSDGLFEGVDFLLLAICLIAVARSSRMLGGAMAALLAGQLLVVLLSVAGLLALSPSAMLVLAALAASVVVVVAIQDITSPQSRWLPALCFAFGAMSGTGIGARLVREWGFAGTHVVPAFLGCVLTFSIGEVWGIALLWSSAGIIRRRGRIAELAVVSTAIFAGHAALHRVMDQGQALADAGTLTLDHFLFTITAGWALLIVSAGMVGTLLAAGAAGQSQAIAHPSEIETR